MISDAMKNGVPCGNFVARRQLQADFATHCFWISAGRTSARFFGVLKVTQYASASISTFFKPQDITSADVAMDPAGQPHDNENCKKKA